MTHCRRAIDPVRDVIAADEDNRHIGARHSVQRICQLPLQVRGLGPDDRLIGQADLSTGEGREASSDDAADRLPSGVSAHARRGGIAEHDQFQGRAEAGAIHIVIVRRPLERSPDDLARDLRLDLDHAITDRPEGARCRREAAAAVCRGGCNLARASCTSHDQDSFPRRPQIGR